LAPVYESATPYEDARIFAAAVYCSDGRIGEQMDEFLHAGLRLPRYDRLAIPGGPACLAGRLGAYWEGRGTEDQLRFLASVHDIKRVVLVAHQGCAFYSRRLRVPLERMEAEQLSDLTRAAQVVMGLGPALAVETFFARRVGDRISFEPAAG
jgi:hypothetical protein